MHRTVSNVYANIFLLEKLYMNRDKSITANIFVCTFDLSFSEIKNE